MSGRARARCSGSSLPSLRSAAGSCPEATKGAGSVSSPRKRRRPGTYWIALLRCRRDHLWFVVLSTAPGSRNVQGVCGECTRIAVRESRAEQARTARPIFDFEIATAPLRRWVMAE